VQQTGYRARRRMAYASDLQARLAQLEIGSTASRAVLRDGRQAEVRVEFGTVRSGTDPRGDGP
jgi:S1-C subfamily serine protease